MKVCVLVLSLIPIFVNVADLHADAVWLAGKEKPIFGLIVERSDSGRLLFKKFEASENRFTKMEFSKDEVALVVPTIDQKRLASLQIDDLSQWQSLAEELIGYAHDPVAKSLAFRLTLLCLHHGSQQEGNAKVVESAARNLPFFAASESERELFSKIAFLYCGDQSLLSKLKDDSPRQSRSDYELRLVRSVRRQQFHRAATQINSIEFKSSSTKFIAPATLNDIRIAIAEKRVDRQLLSQLVAIEKAIKLGESPDTKRIAMNPFKNNGSNALRIPRLEEVSPFDLEATEFRNGRWRRHDAPIAGNK